MDIKKMEKTDLLSVVSFLKAEDESLTVPLSERVDLKHFAEKILSLGQVYACLEQQKTVGLIAFYANDEEQKRAYLTYICVSESNRIKGVGLCMMKQMYQVCKDNGMKTIRLSTNRKNLSAQKFYEKQGYSIIESSPEEYVYELEI